MHVYGYKGENLDCKDNIHLSFDKKTILYCKSSLVVLHNTETGVQKFFKNHTREVTALAVWPTKQKQLAASGQNPDPVLKGKSLIFIWDYVTLEVLRRFEHNNRATISLQFSPHLKIVYAMNNDDDHSIIGYSLQKKLKKRPQRVELNASKSAAIGLVCHSNPKERTDYLVIFGRKLLKFAELTSKDKGETFNFPKLRTVRTNNDSERGFYGVIFPPGNKSEYLAGGHSGKLYR